MASGSSPGPPPCCGSQSVPVHVYLHGSEALERRETLVPGRTGSLHFGRLQHLSIYVDRLLTTHTFNEPERRSIARPHRPSAPNPSNTTAILRPTHFMTYQGAPS